jgi:hypothetical protein
MNIRKTLLVSLLIILVIVSAAYCEATCKDLLPDSGKVKSFEILKGTLQYGKGDDITKIYDGGYELYLENGVIDAARQLYQQKNDYVEVTVHTMKSAKNAKDFTMYWVKVNKAKKNVSPSKKKPKWETYTSQLPGTSITYGCKGKIFFTVSTLYKGKKADKDTKKFTDFLIGKISE